MLVSIASIQETLRSAQRLLQHDPLHQTTYRHLMRLYAVLDDQASAVRTYHTCVTVLERELATEPSWATREVYERLVQAKKQSGFPLSIARRCKPNATTLGQNRWPIRPQLCILTDEEADASRHGSSRNARTHYADDWEENKEKEKQ